MGGGRYRVGSRDTSKRHPSLHPHLLHPLALQDWLQNSAELGDSLFPYRWLHCCCTTAVHPPPNPAALASHPKAHQLQFSSFSSLSPSHTHLGHLFFSLPSSSLSPSKSALSTELQVWRASPSLRLAALSSTFAPRYRIPTPEGSAFLDSHRAEYSAPPPYSYGIYSPVFTCATMSAEVSVEAGKPQRTLTPRHRHHLSDPTSLS